MMEPTERNNLNGGGKKKRTGMIVGIILGVLFALILVGAGIFLMLHRLSARVNPDIDSQGTITAFFDESDMTVNWDMSSISLENGAVYMSEDGSTYERHPAYWTIEKKVDEASEDGYRSIEFDALVQFHKEDIPENISGRLLNCGWGIYDYNTGMRLPNEDGTYTLDIAGKQVVIDIVNYSFKSEDGATDSNYFRQYLISYSIRIPSDYEGIVFAAEAMPDSYAEFEELVEMEAVSAPTIMDDYSAVKEGLRYRFILDGTLDTESAADVQNSEEASKLPFFEENGMSMNWDMSETYLEKGSAFCLDDGSNYQWIPANWAIEKVSDTITEDGYRILDFEANMQIYKDDIPKTEESCLVWHNFDLFDYYSGACIPQEEGEYMLNINGEEISIVLEEYLFEQVVYADSSKPYLEYRVNYRIRMPEKYDGLVFAAEILPDSYEKLQKMNEMAIISEPTIYEDYTVVKEGLRYRFTSDRNSGAVTDIPGTEEASKLPFFEENGIDISWDMSETYLEKGIAFYTDENGGDYQPIPAYASMEIVSDTQTADGYRSIEFAAYHNVLKKDIPVTDKEFWTIAGFGLYDYYTGMCIMGTEGTYTFNSAGKDITIIIDEYIHDRTVSWQDGESYIQYMTSFTLRIPRDYDGLVFGVPTIPDTYEQFEKDFIIVQDDTQGNVMMLDHYNNVKNGLNYRFK